MPGNEVGDTIHNFFPHENLPCGQNHLPSLDGNWIVPGNNIWAGSQSRVASVNPSAKNYNLQQSDSEREQIGLHLHRQHALNFAQSAVRPEFGKSQPQTQPANFNGSMYGNQLYQSSQDETCFVEGGTNASQHNQASRGIFMYGSQHVNGPENESGPSVRPEASGSPVGIEFLGGQQQMNYQQLNMMRSLQLQQSGLNDMQPLPQQVMLMKMHELQRQQQLQQVDAQQRNIASQVPAFAKQASGNHSLNIINGSQNADGLGYHWANELGNADWLQRNTPSVQGFSTGLAFSPNQSPARCAVEFVPQQVDKSLYGISLSGAKGVLNQYPLPSADKRVAQQLTVLGNHASGTQCNAFPVHVNVQDELSLVKQRFHGENSFGHVSSQSLSPLQGEYLQQVNSMRRSASQQEFHAKQVIDVGPDKLERKTEMQVASCQDDVALDPTEERILFGSDDNIWAAFGKIPDTGGVGGNPFDGAGFSGSIQGGTWSALMQSAVAETSCGDQEEWSGLSFQITPGNGPHGVGNDDGGNEPVKVRNGGGKRPTHLGVDNLPKASSLSSESFPRSDDMDMNKNYQNVQGFQQFGAKSPSDAGLMLQVNSSQGLEQFSSRQSGAISVHTLLSGASLVHGNASHSLDSEIRKGTFSLWTPENSSSRRISSKQEGGSIFGSVMPYQDAAVVIRGHENSLQRSWGNDQMQAMQKEVLQGGTPGRPNSHVSSAEPWQVKPSAGNVQGNNEGFHLTNPAMILDSSSTRTDQGSDNFPPSSYNINYWKIADSVVNSKGGMQHDDRSPSKEGRGPHKENSDKQENSYDSYHSNLSHRANDSRTQSAATQKSNQTGRKNSAVHKFQYHPMGNLNDDVEPPNRFKQSMHSEAMAHFGQPKFYGQMPKSSPEMGKEQPPGHDRSAIGFDEVLAPGNFAGSPACNLAPSGYKSDIQVPNRASHSSQNMLELLHKVDRSGEEDIRVYSSHPNSLSGLSQAENCDQSGGRLQRSQSSNSQGFGLRLGPPLRQSIPNPVLASQSFMQTTNSSHSSHAGPDSGHEGNAQWVPESCNHSIPASSDRFQGISNIESPGLPGQSGYAMSVHKMSGNYSAENSGVPYSSGQLQNQAQVARSPEKHVSAAWREEINIRPCISHFVETSLPDNSASLKSTSPQFTTNILPGRVSGSPALPVSQSPSIVGSSSRGSLKSFSNLWTNMAAQEHLLQSQLQKMASQFQQPYQPKIVNSTSASFGQNDADAKKRGTFPFEFPAGTVNLKGVGPEEKHPMKEATGQQLLPGNVNFIQKNNELQGEVPPMVRTLSDGSPANSTSSQRDFEAFGQSPKPNNLFQKNYSLLNQMQAVENLENDPRSQVLKRIEGEESCLGSQLIAPPTGQLNRRDAMTGGTVVSEEATFLSFSGPVKNLDASASSEHGNVTPQGTLLLNPDLSQSCNDSARVVDHSKISPQMAPSWFNQYGTFKNEQMLPVHYSRLAATVKSGQQPLTLGKSCDAVHILNSVDQSTVPAVDMSQAGSIQHSAPPSSVVAEHLPFQGLAPSVGGQHEVIMRTRKRKSATPELHPWHKEVLQASRDLWDIRAEFDWAKATNRLTQKVEEDVEFLEEGPPMLRSKRRLILTAQLMQQLFRPPRAAILSMDANSDHKTVVYSVSRVALGDACRMVSFVNREVNMSHDCMEGLSDECKTSNRLDQHLLKVTEEFTARARKLESDFLRLDKRASVLDLIVECQDLEKFSVINRFAKFHGRGQAENVETASSSDAVSNQKPCPQRYVTALPLPRNLPTGVQCHSL